MHVVLTCLAGEIYGATDLSHQQHYGRTPVTSVRTTDQYVTSGEAANRLRCSEATIRRYLKAGKFEGARKPLGIWLIPVADITALLAGGAAA